MNDDKRELNLDESEASLALHALRFYINAKDDDVSENTKGLEAKLDWYLSGTVFEVTQIESLASILGSRGGTKGGASTSAAKRAAAAANGAKGGRPRNPNLFIKFAKAVWSEPDPVLLNELYTQIGTNSWLPDEQGGEKSGPYVRVYIPEITKKLEKQLNNSMNVFEWDNKPFYRLCDEHKNDLCKSITAAEKARASSCTTCGAEAKWVY